MRKDLSLWAATEQVQVRVRSQPEEVESRPDDRRVHGASLGLVLEQHAEQAALRPDLMHHVELGVTKHGRHVRVAILLEPRASVPVRGDTPAPTRRVERGLDGGPIRRRLHQCQELIRARVRGL